MKNNKLSKDPRQGLNQYYAEYDVIVHSTLNQVPMDLIHFDLIQDFLSAEKMHNYTKTVETRDLFRKAGGKGLLFSEGE